MPKDELIIKIKDPLDRSTADKCQSEILTAIDNGYANVTLDLQDLSYMDSSGVAVLIQALRRISQLKGRLDLQKVQPAVMRILKIAALDKITHSGILSIQPINENNFLVADKEPPGGHYGQVIVKADIHEISKARERLKNIIFDIGLSEKTSYDVLVATCEALNNSIEHGVADCCSTIAINVSYSFGLLEVVIKDSGCGFDYNSLTRRGHSKFSTRGRGITLMKSLMDEVHFEHQPDGMLVRMSKKIGI